MNNDSLIKELEVRLERLKNLKNEYEIKGFIWGAIFYVGCVLFVSYLACLLGS